MSYRIAKDYRRPIDVLQGKTTPAGTETIGPFNTVKEAVTYAIEYFGDGPWRVEDGEGADYAPEEFSEYMSQRM